MIPDRLAGVRERLGEPGRAALAVWGASRLGLVVTAWLAPLLFIADAQPPGRWLGRWDRWDVGIFVRIARYGYFGDGSDPTDVAFLPGFPGLLRAMHWIVPSWTVAGLVLSLAAGCVAAVGLARISALESSAEDSISAARNSVLFFALAPAAVFLAAGYTESLFAALAFSAWYSARNDRWRTAAVLAAAASCVRVNGLFLAAAIALEFLLAGSERRSWRQLPLLVVPTLPFIAYVVYLQAHTGDWLAWQHAQEVGWQRHFRDPVSAWRETWRAAFGRTQTGHVAWVFQLELLAVAAGVALTLFLMAVRRFPEALYVGLSLLALCTSTWFMSVPRAMLLWWPLWTLLGAAAVRWRILKTVYVCCVAPISVGIAILFFIGQWAG